MNDAEFQQGALLAITENFSPVTFYDLGYSKEHSSETSKVNNDEVEVIQKLLWKMIGVLANHDKSGSKTSGDISQVLYDRFRKKNESLLTDEKL